MKEKKVCALVSCQVCHKSLKPNEAIHAGMLRGHISEKIKSECPDWSSNSYICISDLNRFRGEYIEETIRQDKGELSALETQVVESLKKQELLAINLNEEFDKTSSVGERVADKIADFGGSWKFIGIFGGVLFSWVAVNTTIFFTKPFDPYPYIFLNLVLSCLAAIQAPVIMMSQNRQEAKDRLRAEHDYKVNLKAELEIRHLHEKIDHLIMNQWQRLLEIQEIQTELMEELAEKKEKV